MEKKYLDVVDIKNFLPHRYPFLLIDRVLEWGPEYVKAIKNVTSNEEFFNGHFPITPVMPGVLMIEAMAQASCFMSYDELVGNTDKKLDVLFMGMENVRFRKVVTPGDQLVIEAKLVKKKREFWWIDGKAFVDGVTVCEASMSAILKVSGKL